MATSSGALGKSSNIVDPEFYDNDPEVIGQSARTKNAQKVLEDILERKKNQVSPTMLALAGALFDPGKTGSAGEAVGRAATAYSGAQQAEQKNALEDAGMQYQLEQMRLADKQKSATMRMLGGFKLGQASGDATQAPQGDATQIAQNAGLKEGETPTGSSGPALKINGYMMTPDMIAKLMIADPVLGKAFKEGYELKLSTMTATQGHLVNKITGESVPLVGGKAEPVYVPEIGGTLMMNPQDSALYHSASSKQDGETVYKLINRLTKGVARPVESTTPTATASSSTEPIIPKPLAKPVERIPHTVESLKTESEARSESAKTLAKDYAEATTKFLGATDYNRESQNAAADVKAMLEDKKSGPKLVGLFDRKGFAPAFWNLVSSTMSVEGGDSGARARADLAKVDLQKIVMQVDKSFTNEDIAKVNAIAGNLARMELGLRKQTYAGSGMGSVSNMEGIPIQQIIGSRYENAESLRRKMATIGRGFQLDSDIAQAYREWASKPENSYKHLEDFKRDPGGVYKGLIQEANAWAVQNLKIPARSPSALVEPSAASSGNKRPAINNGITTRDAIAAEAERRRKEKEKGKQ